MYEIFAKLLEEKGLRASNVCKGTGISATVFSEWKKGKSKPNTEKMIKIANFLNVSVEYLMTGKKESTLTPKDERDISKVLNETLSQLDSNDGLMFDGEALDDETKELLKISLEGAIRSAKIKAKAKFTNDRYKKG